MSPGHACDKGKKKGQLVNELLTPSKDPNTKALKGKLEGAGYSEDHHYHSSGLSSS